MRDPSWRTNALIAREADLALVWMGSAASNGRRLAGLRDPILPHPPGLAETTRLLATHAAGLAAGRLAGARDPRASPRPASRRGRPAGAARFGHRPGGIPRPRSSSDSKRTKNRFIRIEDARRGQTAIEVCEERPRWRWKVMTFPSSGLHTPPAFRRLASRRRLESLDPRSGPGFLRESRGGVARRNSLCVRGLRRRTLRPEQ